MQSKADGIYQLFVDSVARNIGLSADKVRATQAAMYMGATGVEMGLAHEVGSFEEVLQMAVRQAGPFRLDGQAQEIFMTASDKGNGGPVQITAEQLEAARTEGHAAGLSAGRAETAPAVTAAVTAERSRIQGIVTHAEATGRAELAAHLAFETDMAADQATALLAKSPKAQAGSPLDRAMAAEGGAHVAAQPGPEPTSTQPVIDANDIFARRAAAAKQKR
jgi:ClpP class serine protease